MPINEMIDAPVVAAVAAPSASAAITADAYFSVATQYVYRGVALRDKGPVPMAAFTLNHSRGWFIDAWAGQVDSRDYSYRTYPCPDYANRDYSHRDYPCLDYRCRDSIAREWQIESSVGYAAPLNDTLQWSLSRAWINGIGNKLSASKNYQEWRLNFFYRDNFSTQFAYTDNYRQLGWASWNAEGNYRYALNSRLVSEFGFGHSHGAGNRDADYNYGWAGLSAEWLRTEWDLRWIHSTSEARYVIDASRAGSRVELTLSWPLSLIR